MQKLDGTGGQAMRLIDADRLMDSLRGNVLIDVTPELEDTIAQQPTAFDKEKVIEELKNLKNNLIDCNDLCGECVETECDQCALDKAIKIVGKGGIE